MSYRHTVKPEVANAHFHGKLNANDMRKPEDHITGTGEYLEDYDEVMNDDLEEADRDEVDREYRSSESAPPRLDREGNPRNAVKEIHATWARPSAVAEPVAEGWNCAIFTTEQGAIEYDEEELCEADMRRLTPQQLVDRICDGILRMNPHLRLTKDHLLQQALGCKSYNRIVYTPEHQVSRWNLSQLSLTAVPAALGFLRVVDGNLTLQGNQLRHLPPTLGRLYIGGNLDLSENQIEALPEDFGSILVGCHINLSQNKLRTLPESFGRLKVGGSLFLDGNELDSFPSVCCGIELGCNTRLAHMNFGQGIDGLHGSCETYQHVLRVDSHIMDLIPAAYKERMDDPEGIMGILLNEESINEKLRARRSRRHDTEGGDCGCVVA